MEEYFLDEIFWEKLKKKLKKFTKGKKKRFFIRYKYPHRRSIARYKSYVTTKRYLTKHKIWYTAKKGCLRFYNFEKISVIDCVSDSNTIMCNYQEICEFNKKF